MNILRFITAGSVDDGKSTLIGRLLYDSKSILADQLEALEQQSKNKNEDGIDLAILTDGLRAEREQGITIDVAYRYFATPKRKFIIADAPGHTQYTRNMITGASNSQLIIILVDARNGVTEQTRRHSIIASLLNIPEVVVAVNKMDLVGYSEETFNSIKDEYQQIATHLGLKNVHYFPISAFVGDNIVNTTQAMTWYKGVSLLDFLETVEINPHSYTQPRFQVQYVIRPQTEALHDYRGYAGEIISGTYRKGDAIVVLPEGISTTISKIEHNGKEVLEAKAGTPVVIHIDDDIDIEINPADLRIDVYRASGAGGQHVNKTESAVRITHMPSGIVVQCQNGRSQHQNKDQAMKQLKAKLFEMEMMKKNAEKQAMEESKSDIGWGSQIRSYVLDDSRIKDLRTGVENRNTQAVLDGDLDRFIEASLKAGL